jgi:hypothetical protein
MKMEDETGQEKSYFETKADAWGEPTPRPQ